MNTTPSKSSSETVRIVRNRALPELTRPRTSLRLFANLLTMAALCVPKAAFAGSGSRCGEGGQPWVGVAFSGGSWSEGLKEAALQDLRAGLANHNIETCAQNQGPERPPVAVIVISFHGSESVQVTVEIRDAVTEKRVSRDVDLTGMPDDGHALAIALAADELVWASWAEIGYKGTRRRRAAPPQVVAAVEQNLQQPQAMSVRLGAQVAAEHYAAGLTQFGADALCVLSLTHRFRLRIAAGARQGLTVLAPDGRVQSTATGLAFDGGALLLQSSRAELTWTLGSRLAWLHTRGEAAPGVFGDSLNGIAIYARSGLNAAVHLGGAMWFEFGAGVGVPLRAIEANDTGRVVTGASGLEQSALLALLGEL